MLMTVYDCTSLQNILYIYIYIHIITIITIIWNNRKEKWTPRDFASFSGNCRPY